jgi:hypothetical protein
MNVVPFYVRVSAFIAATELLMIPWRELDGHWALPA